MNKHSSSLDIYLYCLIALVKTSSNKIEPPFNRNGENKHPYLIPHLKGLLKLSIILAEGGFIVILLLVEKFPLIFVH